MPPDWGLIEGGAEDWFRAAALEVLVATILKLEDAAKTVRKALFDRMLAAALTRVEVPGVALASYVAGGRSWRVDAKALEARARALESVVRGSRRACAQLRLQGVDVDGGVPLKPVDAGPSIRIEKRAPDWKGTADS